MNREELERLTETWAIWVEKATTPERAIARARLHLFFLLARYAGLRSSEIFSFHKEAQFDSDTGLLQLKDRKLFMPPAALRPMRRILTLPESRTNDFLRLDAGFLRRTFYEIGKLAGLQPRACAPRALRYARALELLEMRMAPRIITECLGLANPLLIERLSAQNGLDKKSINRFFAILRSMKTDHRSARLFIQLHKDLALSVISPLEEIADLEPAPGKPVFAEVPPSQIFPSCTPLPMANELPCEAFSLTRDEVENRLRLKIKGGLELYATCDAAFFQFENPDKKRDLKIYIPAHAIKLSSC